MGLVIILLVSYNQFMIAQLERQRADMINQNIPANQTAQDFVKNIHRTAYLISAYVQSGNEAFYREWQQTWNFGLREQISALQTVVESLNDESAENSARRLGISLNLMEKRQAPIINQVRTQLKPKGFYRQDIAFDTESFFTTNENVFIASTDRSLIALQQTLSAKVAGEVVPYVSNVASDAEVLSHYFNRDLNNRMLAINKKLANMRRIGYFTIAFGTIFAIILGFWVIRFIFRHLITVREAIKSLSDGNIPDRLTENRNETNLIIRKINKLGHELGNVKILAEQVGKGHFDEATSAFGTESELGSSLASMRHSLHQVAEEDRRRLWVNEGFAEVAHILRTNNDNLQNLCDEVLHQMVKYLDVNQGALFLLKEVENGSPLMEVKSLYAYNKQKFADKVVEFGSGLIGQSWRDQAPIYLTEVPESYINIRSGLGGAEPNCLLIMPMMANDQVVGILELASFSDFPDHHQDFVRRASESIATAVGNVKMNERTLLLLRETQEQAEELRSQEEEMRQNMEELNSTQEEMMRAQREIIEKERNLDGVINNTEDTIFAINRKYEITVVNKFLRDKYAKMGIELKSGTNILNLLKGETRELWKKRYDRALSGERFQLIEESSGSNGTRFAQTFHNPIRDTAGQVVGISVISRDVTDLMKAQKEVERKEITLNALINSTDDTYFALDREYRILVANKTLRDRFATSGIDIQEGDLIFDKLPEDQHQKWKERYDRIFEGERFIIKEERQVQNTVLHIEGHYVPIKDEEGNVLGAMVMSRDITEVHKALEEKGQRDREIEKLRKQIGLQDNTPLTGNGNGGDTTARSRMEAKLQKSK